MPKIPWTWIFKDFSDEHPGRFVPATADAPATVYLPTRDYAWTQAMLFQFGLNFVSMSDTITDARMRQQHFEKACANEGVTITKRFEGVVVGSNPEDSNNWDPMARFMTCSITGSRSEHVPILFYDRPDGEYRDARALSEARFIVQGNAHADALVIKPLRAVLRWWIVTRLNTGDFLRVLAGNAVEAELIAGAEFKSLCRAEELK